MGYKLPLEIKLQLTEKCNFNCDFCFNKQGSAKCAEMPFSAAKKIISKIADEGIKAVRFTGGEPLLHPKILQLLSFAKKQNLKVLLNTNASLISSQKAKKISPCIDNVLVSMHSLQANAKTIDAVNALSAQGCFVRAATILSKENIQLLENFHEMISALPFSQWVLLRQIPNALNRNPVSNADMQIAIEKIESLNKGRKKKELFLVENALPFCCFYPERVSKVALGGIHEDGHSSLFVDSNSRIRPSYFLDAELGNALQHSFLGAWNNDFLKRMNALEFIADACHKCKYALKCMSGSRFSALLVNKSLYALDPLAKPFSFGKSLGKTAARGAANPSEFL